MNVYRRDAHTSASVSAVRSLSRRTVDGWRMCLSRSVWRVERRSARRITWELSAAGFYLCGEDTALLWRLTRADIMEPRI